MFGYRYPLLEVVQAIEELRESRGTTNKQICDFVRQQGRNPNDPMKILKTIRTLNKLVEEGVLIKRGKRYVFPTQPPELNDNGEEDEEQEQEQEQDSCDEEEDNEEEEEEEEEGGEEEEEEEEEDDDDDDDEEEEEDEDEDEDEDEECEGKEQMPEPEVKSPTCPENSTSKGLSQQKSPLNSGEPKPNENVGGDQERTDKIPAKTSENNVSKKNSLKGSKKNGKGQNCETKNNGKNKGGETIAFCARDFIDSQYTQNSTQAKPVTLHEKPQDDLIETENYDNEPEARAFGMRKRESKVRKNRVGNDCRSRSPIRGNAKNDFFTELNLGHSDELRKNMISSQIFQEMTDTPMDIDHDNEVVDLDFDILRHRSPIGPSSPITPGVRLDRTESCCSQPNTKSPDNIKAELDFDCKNQFFLKKNADYKHSRHSMARAIDIQNKRLAAKEAAEKDKEKHKRELSDEGNDIKAEKRTSLCSVCEKKKRNS